jgi:AsmA protein
MVNRNSWPRWASAAAGDTSTPNSIRHGELVAATRKRWMARFSALILGAFAGLILVALVPMVTGPGNVEPVGSGSRVEAASFDSFAITSPITLATSPLLRLERGTISIDRTTSSKTEAPRLILDRPRFTIEINRRPVASPHTNGPELTVSEDWLPAVARSLADLGFEKLNIRDGRVAFQWNNATETMSSSPTKSIELDNLTADLTTNRKGVVTAQGDARLFGERMTFDSAMATTPETTTNATSRRGLKLTIKAPALQIDFDGRLESGNNVRLVGQMDANVGNASALTQWLAVPMPQSPVFRDLQLKGQLDWNNGVIAVDKAVITSDRQSPAAGAISFSFNGPRPVVNGTLAYNAFDLGAYVSFGLPEAVRAEPANRHWRSMTTALPHIRHFDADLRVSANAVRLGDLSLGRGAASIVVQAGKMTVDLAELATADERFNAQIGIDMTEARPLYKLRGKMETANLGPHFDGGPVPAFISGKAEVQFDLKGQGETLSQILSVATGRLTLRGGAGGRAMLDTGVLKALADHHARRDGKKPATPTPTSVLSKAPQTFDAIDVRMTMLGGFAMIEQATVKQSGNVTQITGWIDTTTRDLNLSAVQYPRQAATAKKTVTGGELNSYEVKGPWTDLVVRRMENAAALP